MPKFLGMEPKTLLWVGGGLAALIVVYYVIRSRSGGEGAAVGGDLGGGFSGGVGGSAPVSYNPGAPDSGGDAYQQQLNDLDIQARQEALREQKGMYELQQEQNKQQLGLWGAQQSLLFEGARQEQQFQLGYEQEAYRTAQAAQEVVTRSVKGKKKVECPVGQHLVVLADGTPACQDKGGGGLSFGTIFGGVGNILEGLFSGAAAAAPGIGYGAANAVAANAGIYKPPSFAQTPQRAAQPAPSMPRFTPPINSGGAGYSLDYSSQHAQAPNNPGYAGNTMEQFPRIV